MPVQDAPRLADGRLRALGPGARRPHLSVVIPVYDEAESLPQLHRELQAATAGIERQIIYVDDGSTDASFEVLTRLGAGDPTVRILRFARNFGKSQALAAGLAEAQGRVVVTMDADLQDDPAELPRLVAAVEAGADLVVGWKRERRDPWTKRLPSRIFNGLAARVTGLGLHDINCGFKAYSRRLIDHLDVYGEQHRVFPVLAWWQGFRVTELPVHHRPRRHGRSKFGWWRFFAGVLDLTTVVFLTRFNRKPLHLFGLVGFGLAAVGVVISLYMTWLRLQGETIGNRPLLLLGVLLLVMGVQVVSIGLLGEIMAAHAGRSRRPLTRVYDVVVPTAETAEQRQPAIG